MEAIIKIIEESSRNNKNEEQSISDLMKMFEPLSQIEKNESKSEPQTKEKQKQSETSGENDFLNEIKDRFQALPFEKKTAIILKVISSITEVIQMFNSKN